MGPVYGERRDLGWNMEFKNQNLPPINTDEEQDHERIFIRVHPWSTPVGMTLDKHFEQG